MNAMPPVDPFAHKADNELTADLGSKITTRGRSMFERMVVWLILGLIASAAGYALVLSGYTAVTDSRMLLSALIGFTISAGIVYACWLGFTLTFREIDFHERGLLERTWSKRRVFRYEDLVGLTYSLTRQYINGIYAGTALVLHVAASDGRKLKYTGRHKEKPKGLAMTVFGRKFEGEDELDVVKDVISAYVARRLAADIAQKPIVWGGAVAISGEGVTPRGGKHKGQLVAWSRIVDVGAQAGAFHLFAQGDKRSFATMMMAAPNFYPGLNVFLSLRDAAGGGQAAGATGQAPPATAIAA